ncbi:Sir2 family NAD-dependent protein deacetylase, partial [Mordavella massiliensis]|uniref:Sir2 family NAD-dependent protein deacetylase n=1 Tax=Mordavella massiliensis TaxID=1871024 RepID=UPI0023EE926D|nr:hypothetical protein [Mordavella massiliensis]
ILTAVDYVYVHYNQPDQKTLKKLTISEAKKYIDEKEFAAGSMLPKIEACMSFVKDHPDREAIITSLSGLMDAKDQELFDQAKQIVFLTGAGVSTASGIPDFRSANGLYTQNHNAEY